MNTAQRKDGTPAQAGALLRRLAAALPLLALLSVAAPVPAADRERFVLPSLPMDRGAQQPRQAEPRHESREQRSDQARRPQPDSQGDAQRRGQRMTPDERRDLRRQINEAGMDLYPNRRR